MKVDDILKIIESIPEYITYIYPGYLSIYCYFFLRGKTLKETNAIVVKALAISYIYIIFLDALKIESTIVKNMIYISVAIVCPYIVYRVARSKFIIAIFEFLKINTTFYDNEMETLAEFDRGAWVVVYLKNDDIVYEGALGLKELEEEKRQYISLNKY